MDELIRKLVNKKTMTVCTLLGVVSIPYWLGYFAGHIEETTIQSVFEILEHKDD